MPKPFDQHVPCGNSGLPLRCLSAGISGGFVRSLFIASTMCAAAFLMRSAAAQSTASAPIDPSDVQSTAPANSTPVLTLKANVRRVVVDVVVTDPKGQPVTTLSKGDFNVTEDDTPQHVRDFELHTITTPPTYVLPEVPKLPANTFLNLATAPTTGTPTVLLYDVLNTPLDAQAYAHQEMIKFLKHRRPGVQVAIFVLGSKLQLLQGFTDDQRQLEAALERKKGQPSSSLLLGATDAANTPTNSLVDTVGNSNAATAPTADANFTQVMSLLNNMEALDQADLLDQRVEITLNALTEIGRFLAGLPGRKNLVWLSASFPAGILPDGSSSTTQAGHDQSLRNYGAAMKEATDLLNLSHVAVYPVDIRGLQTGSEFSASSNQTFAPNTSQLLKATQSSGQTRGSEHATMDSIADSTGGHAYYNTNDLQEAVGDAMASGSTYYSLTYSPTNPNFDGGLRKIKIKLRQSGYTLSYRKTYFADDLHKAQEEAEDQPISPLAPSLEHGTPLSHELLVEAHLDTLGPPAAATPQQMEVLSRFDSLRFTTKHKGPPKPLPPVMMQRYVIEYGLVPRQLELPEESTGTHRGSLEFGVISYNAGGDKLNGIDTTVDDSIPAPRWKHLQTDGYHVVQTIAVPVTASSLRLAVRDVLDNHVGSLEVQLPLVKAPPPTLNSPEAAAPAPAASPSK